MIALVNTLPDLGYNAHVLTGAPVTFHYDNELSDITNRRMIDHYLEEGIKSSAFSLRRVNILRGVMTDFLRLMLGSVIKINSNHQLPAQHTPVALREYEKAQGYINFFLIYKVVARLPLRVRSLLLALIAWKSGCRTIITTTPFPIRLPFFLKKRFRIIQFVHDLMPLNILETPVDATMHFAKDIVAAVRNCDIVITSSHNARRKLLAAIEGIEASVVYLPCSSLVKKEYVHKQNIIATNKSIGSEFILFMSTLEKRKNAARLIDAYSAIHSLIPQKLVLIGGRGYGYEEINNALKRLPPEAQRKVVTLGYVSESEKWSLLSGASLVAHPAVDEGLGIPVIEAFLAGVPVVATRLDSIEEFSPKECVTYIEDPYDAAEIADKLLFAIHNLSSLKRATLHASPYVEEFFSDANFKERLGKALGA